MQESPHENRRGADHRVGPGQEGILEGRYGVASYLSITNGATEVARVFGARPASKLVPSGTVLTVEGSKVAVYAGEQLLWTHAGEMRVLQGVGPRDVLGSTWVIVNGTPTVPGDPSPGIREPILAKIQETASDTTVEELFKQLWKAIGL